MKRVAYPVNTSERSRGSAEPEECGLDIALKPLCPFG